MTWPAQLRKPTLQRFRRTYENDSTFVVESQFTNFPLAKRIPSMLNWINFLRRPLGLCLLAISGLSFNAFAQVEADAQNKSNSLELEQTTDGHRRR